MAKVAKVKKREVSLHSRAARRASPPVKELAAKTAVVETDYKPWLHNAQNAGINKKTKAKPLTRQQKVRQQKAFEKADVIVDKLERKVAGSKARAKKVQARAKDWEELNGEVETGQGASDSAATKAGGAASGEEGAQVMEDVERLAPEPAHVMDEATLEANVTTTADNEADWEDEEEDVVT